VNTARLAGFATRLLGCLIDLAILNLAALAAGGAIAWGASIVGLELDTAEPVLAALATAGWLLMLSGYFVTFWYLTGQTPGMRFMGIRVIDRGGATPGLVRSLLRLAGSILAALPMGAGFLLILVDDRRRGLQDRIAGTLVIHGSEAPRRAIPARERARPPQSVSAHQASDRPRSPAS
jgi:uncharacterized RDD family membrane protein YckC